LSPKRFSTRLTVAVETPVSGDRLAGHALAAQHLDLVDRGLRRWLTQMLRPRAAVL
jgi:hypothetical protein